jgi:hypothetical protein
MDQTQPAEQLGYSAGMKPLLLYPYSSWQSVGNVMSDEKAEPRDLELERL